MKESGRTILLHAEQGGIKEYKRFTVVKFKLTRK
jgi:hypothetical protein